MSNAASAGAVPQIDEDAARILEAMRKANRPPFEQLTPAEGRAQMRAMREAMKQPVPEMAEVRNIAADGPHGAIPMRLYRSKAAGAGPAPVLVFFHGGGWVVGDLETHDISVRHFADAMGGVAIAVDYRLAPEHKFPAAADDSIAATQWIAANAAALNIDASRLAVGGDSAGGNLAAVVALAAAAAGAPKVRAQVLIYPTVDLRMNYESYKRVGEGFTLTAGSMEWFRDHYLNSKTEVEDWRASPLLAKNHAAAPPAYVVTAGLDPLCDEGEAYAKALQQAGVETQFRCCSGQMHGFIGAKGIIRQADMVIDEIGAFLKTKLG